MFLVLGILWIFECVHHFAHSGWEILFFILIFTNKMRNHAAGVTEPCCIVWRNYAAGGVMGRTLDVRYNKCFDSKQHGSVTSRPFGKLWQIDRPTNQPPKQTTKRPTNQLIHRPINRRTDRVVGGYTSNEFAEDCKSHGNLPSEAAFKLVNQEA